MAAWRYEGFEPIEMDERWATEYADWGIEELTRRLKRYSDFLDWLDEKEREEE